MSRRGRLVVLAALAGGVVLAFGGAPAGDPSHSRAGPASPDAAAADADVALGQELAGTTRADRRRPDRTAVLPPTHTVEAGDTLGALAERYSVATGSLARANAFDHGATLRPGQVLVLPLADPHGIETPEEVVSADLAVESLLEETAAEFGLDLPLVQAVAWQESRWVQRVVSHRGAIGIMQVRPTTGEAVSRELGRELDLYDVTDNVVAGSAYLAQLLDRYSGDLPAALAGYYQGPRSVAERGRIPATQRYVTRVLALRERFAAARAAR